MDTDKSRHALARAKAARDRQARRDWLAAMTPEHRAIHERPIPVICGICLQQSGENLQGVMRGLLRNRPGV
jgi:hypothetical protein